MVHDLDPFLWQISGSFGIRWYGLAYLAGFVFAFFMFRWIGAKQGQGMNAEKASDFITYCALGTLIGGRLGYVLFYSPSLITQVKGSFPYWGVLAVNEGGMASHGGMIGLSVAALLFAKKHSMSHLYLLDLMCIAGPIGVFFGRVANFINGELVGRVAPANFSFAVKFPSDILSWPSVSFQKLQELTDAMATIGVPREQWLEYLDRYRSDGAVRDLVQSKLYALVEAIQSGNNAAKEAIAIALEPRYPSQLFAAFGEGLFIFVVLFFMWRKSRKPGVIAATFISLYAVIRIIGEQFREPDLDIGFQLFNLTRGQWLSVGMLLIGLTLLLYWGRREAVRTPGWGKAASVRLHRK